jgi:hypothetical protein
VQPPAHHRRAITALACAGALLSGIFPAAAAPADPSNAQILQIINSQSCVRNEALRYEDDLTRAAAGGEPQSQMVAQFNAATPSPSPSPSVSPSAYPTPGFAPRNNGTTTLVATPRPQPGTTAGPTPPPIPTPTPNPYVGTQPVYLVRGGSTPPPITPAGQIATTPAPAPTGVATLAPNSIAVIANTVTGNTKPGEPGDATGNVHIFYAQEEIVGEDAHFDGLRTITITGHPFIINHAKNSILEADKIVFDTISQTALLTNGRGMSNEGVDRGLVHFDAKNLHTDASGVGHGLAPSVTTCENARGGYHITGKNMTVYPGDKIVILDAILWLGAAAVFWLPKVVIPLRTVQNPAYHARPFPEVGYDQYDGYWIKTETPFGKDQYYYGYYILNYYTLIGPEFGYNGTFASKNGRRSGTIYFLGRHDRRQQQDTYNANVNETENFSRTVHGNFQLAYQSNYGPYTNVPANESISGTIAHQTMRTSQNYQFSRNSTGSQAGSDSFGFSDNRQFNQALSNALNFTMSSSNSNYGGITSSNSSATLNDLWHFTTAGADYQLTYNKTFSQQPYGINKLPEVQIRPYKFFDHFVIPTSANFTIGEYSQPSNSFSTARTDLAFVLGPAIYHIFNSDFQGTVNVNQFAYGTGDLKASIQQLLQLTTPLGSHFTNTITYNEANYNGPAFVPFQQLDTQPTSNTKNAQDLVRLFNGNAYNVSLGFSTNFNRQAQPVSYQIALQPSARSVVLLSGSFIPNSAGPLIPHGFTTTNVQFSMPLGPNTQVQMVTDVDWTNHARLENKIIYLTKTIGNCYQIQALYNQSMQSVAVQLNLLAFPSRGQTFNIATGGSYVPTTFNGFSNY